MPSIDSLKASDGTGPAAVATVQSVRAPAATTIVVDTVENIPTNFHGTMGTPHTFVDPVTSEQITVISEATAVDFKGHVDGTDLEIDTIAPGFTDAGSAVNDIVIIKPTTQWADEVAEVLEVSLDDDGILKDDIVTTAKIADSNVTTAKIADGAVTPNKLALGASTAEVSGLESTASSSYVALTTAQAVTVTVPASGEVLVVLNFISRQTGGGQIYGGVELSGANTASLGAIGSTQNEVFNQATAYVSNGFTRLFTGLTPGSTTFTAKYASSSGTASIQARKLTVIPL